MPFIHVGCCIYPVFITHRWHDSNNNEKKAEEWPEKVRIMAEGIISSFKGLFCYRVKTYTGEVQDPLNAEATPAHLQAWQHNIHSVQYCLNLSKNNTLCQAGQIQCTDAAASALLWWCSIP